MRTEEEEGEEGEEEEEGEDLKRDLFEVGDDAGEELVKTAGRFGGGGGILPADTDTDTVGAAAIGEAETEAEAMGLIVGVEGVRKGDACVIGEGEGGGIPKLN